jgi:hypothetical protein
MLNWLSGLWRRMNRWLHKEQMPQIYHRSNLHGRRR